MDFFVDEKDFYARLKYVLTTVFDGSQAEFARKIGIKASTASGYFGDNPPAKIPIMVLRKLVDDFQVNPTWLLTGKESWEPQEQPVTPAHQISEKTPFEREILTLETVLTRRGMSDREVGEAVLSLLGAGSPTSRPGLGQSPSGYAVAESSRHYRPVAVQEPPAEFGADSCDQEDPVKD
jgi:transcriptional regulator with XRE-family HTH domain